MLVDWRRVYIYILKVLQHVGGLEKDVYVLCKLSSTLVDWRRFICCVGSPACL